MVKVGFGSFWSWAVSFFLGEGENLQGVCASSPRNGTLVKLSLVTLGAGEGFAGVLDLR